MSSAARTSRDEPQPARAAGRVDGTAAIAGVVATAAALGISELLAGVLPGATSLVAGVGQAVIDACVG